MKTPAWGVTLLLAVGLGAVAAFGQAPFDIPILLLTAIALILHLFDGQLGPGRSALLGWAFGFGYFLHTMHWILSPFMVDPERHAWMAPFALLFLAAGLALFWGLAFLAARLLTPGARWPLIFTFPAAELLRAYLFTGLPWAMPAQALVDVVPGQALAYVGPFGLNLVILGFALLGAGALAKGASWLSRGASGLLFLGGCATLLIPLSLPEPELTEKHLRLVQPNAAQHEKWDPDKIPVFLNRQLDYSAAPAEGPAVPDLILWSETAIPYLLEHAEPVLEQISAAAEGRPVVLGVQRRQERDYFNSLVLLEGQGAVAQVYDKHHLVPFGEYIPLAHLLPRLGLEGLASQIRGGYSAGPGPDLIELGEIGQALPLICYEAVFPRNLRTGEARPDLILQITNDAWFGSGAGPLQHLAQARMRAIEQGLPVARAANTGVSAMIDPRGRVIAQIPLNAAGFVDAPLPLALAPTLYGRIGDYPLFLLLLFGFGIAAIAGRRV